MKKLLSTYVLLCEAIKVVKKRCCCTIYEGSGDVLPSHPRKDLLLSTKTYVSCSERVVAHNYTEIISNRISLPI